MKDAYGRRVEPYRFTDEGEIPNHPRLPLLIYRAALELPAGDPAAVLEERIRQHGWGSCWGNGIFTCPDFHSTAREVLGIASGEARVRLGGQTGIGTTVRVGDVVIIPAGVGHQNLGSSPDFLVVGGYPDGQTWDLCRGRADERSRARRNIEAVALPARDPVYGREGPLCARWR